MKENPEGCNKSLENGPEATESVQGSSEGAAGYWQQTQHELDHDTPVDQLLQQTQHQLHHDMPLDELRRQTQHPLHHDMPLDQVPQETEHPLHHDMPLDQLPQQTQHPLHHGMPLDQLPQQTQHPLHHEMPIDQLPQQTQNPLHHELPLDQLPQQTQHPLHHKMPLDQLPQQTQHPLHHEMPLDELPQQTQQAQDPRYSATVRRIQEEIRGVCAQHLAGLPFHPLTRQHVLLDNLAHPQSLRTMQVVEAEALEPAALEPPRQYALPDPPGPTATGRDRHRHEPYPCRDYARSPSTRPHSAYRPGMLAEAVMGMLTEASELGGDAAGHAVALVQAFSGTAAGRFRPAVLFPDQCATEVASEPLPTVTPPAAKPEDETRCLICLEHYYPGDAVKRLPCGHNFHPTCVNPWLEDKATCPSCQQTCAP